MIVRDNLLLLMTWSSFKLGFENRDIDLEQLVNVCFETF